MITELDVCHVVGILPRCSESLKTFISGRRMTSYVLVRISFEILSIPGALFFFSMLIASLVLLRDMIESISFEVSVFCVGFSAERSGWSCEYNVIESSSRVSFGLSVYEPFGFLRELCLIMTH